MKAISRMLICFMILALLVPTFASCVDTGDGADTTTGSAELGGNESGDDTDFAHSDIPDDLKFTGTTISFLYWKDVERPEFFVEDSNGESVNDAIYKRNAKVEEQFGITLFFDGTPGNFDNQASFVQAAVNSTQSSADAHDIFAGYSMTGASLAVEGITQDLASYDIMEFDKPWWPASLIEQASINDKIYFASGDISTNFLYMMYGTFFNKDIFINHHQSTETLYNEAINGEWTLDKMIEYSTGVYEDLDGDTTASYEDKYGFMTIDLHFDAFYAGAGLTNLTKNADGELALSPDLFSEKTVSLLEKVNTFLYHSGDAYAKGTTTKDSSAQAFKNERAQFIIDRVYIASGTLKDVSFSYGMLPIPKYDTAQANYVTCMAFPFTMYSLSAASPNPDAAAATLELMAYQSYLLITPALFEESMKLRYSEEGYDSQMYDIIRESVYIDIGRIFTTQLNNYSYSLFRNAVKNDAAGTWASSERVNKAMMDKFLSQINEALSDIEQ